MARKSAAKPSGAPWKLPVDSTRPSGSTTGLSTTDTSSRPATVRGEVQGVAGRAGHLRRAAHRVRVLHARAPGRRGASPSRGSPAAAGGCSPPTPPDRGAAGSRAARAGTAGRSRASPRWPARRSRRPWRTGAPRRAMASSSMPSMPSVPLISASPSLAASSSGVEPGRGAARRRAVTGSPSWPSTQPSPSSTSAQCASGARSPEAPSEPCSGTHGVMSWLSRSTRACGDQRPDPGAAQGERADPQQHHRPDHLARHRRADPGGVRADQRVLQLGPPLRGDERVGERAEPGGDAVDRAAATLDAVHDGPAGRHRVDGGRGEDDRARAAGDREHVVGGDRRWAGR